MTEEAHPNELAIIKKIQTMWSVKPRDFLVQIYRYPSVTSVEAFFGHLVLHLHTFIDNPDDKHKVSIRKTVYIVEEGTYTRLR